MVKYCNAARDGLGFAMKIHLFQFVIHQVLAYIGKFNVISTLATMATMSC